MQTGKLKYLLIGLLCFSITNSFYAQRTIGLISYNPEKSSEGYNLIYPYWQPNVYLLNNCGQIVNTWEDDDIYEPARYAYLLPNGNLVKTKKGPDDANFSLNGSGGGEFVEVRTWDNELVASYSLKDSVSRLHHDIAVTDKNTVLMIAWFARTKEECIAAGRDSSNIPETGLWPDNIIEWDPYLDSIIWRWDSFDHIIQNHDSTKANYGIIELNNNKIDFNAKLGFVEDWLHFNSVDYNPRTDQIIISVPIYHEAWIIDHSTTTLEASGSTGGNSGKGGDILYRWGNPAVYNNGEKKDQRLFFQHDVNWVDDFLDSTHVHYGKIGVFNNRSGTEYSTGNIWDPGFDEASYSFAVDGKRFGPSNYSLSVHHPDTTQLNSRTISSFQVLNNGNFLVCAGRKGYTFELTPDNEIVWEYISPITWGSPAEQDQIPALNSNSIFKLKRYPIDFKAFEDKDMSPKGILEIDSDMDFCEHLVNTKNIKKDLELNVFPNPASEYVTLQWKSNKPVKIQAFNNLGELIFTENGTYASEKQIDTSNWANGIYIIKINEHQVYKMMIAR